MQLLILRVLLQLREKLLRLLGAYGSRACCNRSVLFLPLLILLGPPVHQLVHRRLSGRGPLRSAHVACRRRESRAPAEQCRQRRLSPARLRRARPLEQPADTPRQRSPPTPSTGP